MLVLSRKQHETIQIGANIVVTITQIDRHQVRVGIEAPDDVCILRGELAERKNNWTERGLRSPAVVR